MARQGRKINWARPTKASIVIYDRVGADVVKSLADRPNIPTIAGRGEEICLHPLELLQSFVYFVALVVRRSEFQDLGWREKLFVARAAGRIRLFRPRLVLTNIDNSLAYSALHRIFRGSIYFAAVQNGARSVINYRVSYQLSYDLLFSFGEAEEKLSNIYHHRVGKFVPIGSPRMHLFIESVNGKVANNESLGFCYLSQYRSEVEDLSTAPPHQIAFDEVTRMTAQYFRGNQKAVNILCTTADDREAAYLSKIFSGTNFRLIRRDTSDEFRSYRLGMTASLVISLHSSLGWELMAEGKKVLFANPTMDRSMDHSVPYEFAPKNRNPKEG